MSMTSITKRARTAAADILQARHAQNTSPHVSAKTILAAGPRRLPARVSATTDADMMGLALLSLERDTNLQVVDSKLGELPDGGAYIELDIKPDPDSFGLYRHTLETVLTRTNVLGPHKPMYWYPHPSASAMVLISAPAIDELNNQ